MATKGKDVSVTVTGQQAEAKAGRVLAKGNSRFGPRRKGRYRREELRGSEYDGRGNVMLKERIIDHENDRYTETVISEATGETVHHVEEPLSQHTGHGTARKVNK